jgi:NAD(P)-dependent dehydrogenase (short-subunit alcohol dehydrogenase family)
MLELGEWVPPVDSIELRQACAVHGAESMNPVVARVAGGMVAGLLATAVMSLVVAGGRKLGLLGEPPPRRIVRRLLGRHGWSRPRGVALDLSALAAHLGFGASMGGVYGVLPARTHSPLGGFAFGAIVWAVNYAGWLPKAGLMPPPSRDRLGRPTTMIAAHLVFGRVLAEAFGAIYRPERPLRGKVALICGGSRGLGRATARELIQAGASVAICARDPGPLEETRAWLSQFGGRVLAQRCDLRSDFETLELFAAVARELGPIDIVVVNAATILVAPIETLSPTDFDTAMRETFGTATRAALTALPSMRARRHGTIVFITSIGAKIGVPHLAPYSAAKFAEAGFAEALAAEVAKDGVHVLSVFPGLMRTGSWLHASFRGAPARELRWFGMGAITPLLSIDADRAAKRVVRAIVTRKHRLTFTPAARLAIAMHDLLPVLWSFACAVFARLLPRAPLKGESLEQRQGAELLARPSSLLLRAIAARSARLAARHGQ